jgi:hypothetical protein
MSNLTNRFQGYYPFSIEVFDHLSGETHGRVEVFMRDVLTDGLNNAMMRQILRTLLLIHSII